MINNLALQQRFEPICSHIQKTLGRIIIHAAKCDITLASYPILYMGKFAKLAQENNMGEVANNTLITLLEVGKMIPQQVDIQYLEIKELYQSIIFYMHEIAKETFRQDKESNLKLLTQPFRDLKALFKRESMVGHQDTPFIDRMINSVLEEFTALESVMNTMPPLPAEKQQE